MLVRKRVVKEEGKGVVLANTFVRSKPGLGLCN